MSNSKQTPTETPVANPLTNSALSWNPITNINKGVKELAESASLISNFFNDNAKNTLINMNKLVDEVRCAMLRICTSVTGMTDDLKKKLENVDLISIIFDILQVVACTTPIQVLLVICQTLHHLGFAKEALTRMLKAISEWWSGKRPEEEEEEDETYENSSDVYQSEEGEGFLLPDEKFCMFASTSAGIDFNLDCAACKAMQELDQEDTVSIMELSKHCICTLCECAYCVVTGNQVRTPVSKPEAEAQIGLGDHFNLRELATTVVVAVGTLIFGKAPSMSQVSRTLNDFASYCRTTHNITLGIKAAEFLKGGMCSVFKWLFQHTLWYLVPKRWRGGELSTDIRTWYDAVLSFDDPCKIEKVGESQILREEVYVLVEQGMKFASIFSEKGKTKPVFFEKYLERIMALRKIVEGLKKHTSIREEPFSLQFFGEPGTGKSLVMPIFADYFRTDIYDFEVSPNHSTYARATTGDSDSFWTGYTGQPTVLMDDLFQITNDKCPSTAEFIYIKSSVPYAPPMAAVEDKGRMFTSKALISSTNVAYPQYNHLHSSEALWRRRDLLVEVLNIDDAASDPRNLTHLRFQRHDPLNPMRRIGELLNGEQLKELIKLEYHAFTARRRIYINALLGGGHGAFAFDDVHWEDIKPKLAEPMPKKEGATAQMYCVVDPTNKGALKREELRTMAEAFVPRYEVPERAPLNEISARAFKMYSNIKIVEEHLWNSVKMYYDQFQIPALEVLSPTRAIIVQNRMQRKFQNVCRGFQRMCFQHGIMAGAMQQVNATWLEANESIIKSLAEYLNNPVKIASISIAISAAAFYEPYPEYYSSNCTHGDMRSQCEFWQGMTSEQKRMNVLARMAEVEALSATAQMLEPDTEEIRQNEEILIQARKYLDVTKFYYVHKAGRARKNLYLTFRVPITRIPADIREAAGDFEMMPISRQNEILEVAMRLSLADSIAAQEKEILDCNKVLLRHRLKAYCLENPKTALAIGTLSACVCAWGVYKGIGVIKDLFGAKDDGTVPSGDFATNRQPRQKFVVPTTQGIEHWSGDHLGNDSYNDPMEASKCKQTLSYDRKMLAKMAAIGTLRFGAKFLITKALVQRVIPKNWSGLSRYCASLPITLGVNSMINGTNRKEADFSNQTMNYIDPGVGVTRVHSNGLFRTSDYVVPSQFQPQTEATHCGATLDIIEHCVKPSLYLIRNNEGGILRGLFVRGNWMLLPCHFIKDTYMCARQNGEADVSFDIFRNNEWIPVRVALSEMKFLKGKDAVVLRIKSMQAHGDIVKHFISRNHASQLRPFRAIIVGKYGNAISSALLSCIISRDVMGARSWSERRRQASPAQPPGPPHHAPPSQQHLHYAALVTDHHNQQKQQPQQQPTMGTSSLYTSTTVQERRRLESGTFRDRQVRLQSVQADLLLDLPHAIALPEEDEGGCRPAVKILHLRGGDEIYRGYIRPPPNRTLWEGGGPSPPPPYHHHSHQRSSSANKARDSSNSRQSLQRASYPQGGSCPTNSAGRLSRRQEQGVGVVISGGNLSPEGSLEYSEPPPCYSDVIAGQDFCHQPQQRHSTGNVHKSEL